MEIVRKLTEGIEPLGSFLGKGRNSIPAQSGVYAFWWLGDKKKLFASRRDIWLKGPAGSEVKLKFKDWFPPEAPHPALYVGKSTNLKNRISLHILIGKTDKLYPASERHHKVKPVTTSCQLRTGIEHIFPKEKDPSGLILKEVGVSFVFPAGDDAVAERFYLEDLAVGFFRPWFNLDSER